VALKGPVLWLDDSKFEMFKMMHAATLSTDQWLCWQHCAVYLSKCQWDTASSQSCHASVSKFGSRIKFRSTLFTSQIYDKMNSCVYSNYSESVYVCWSCSKPK